ncbi:MAG: NfuA family Fe-S biogenesis protein [Xanthomonadaceae bacterium]|jgi:Fe/S biogenesis protein NfuA|nr:NfuA family Fe-S biogenesis protein [Xanthomonadaceae bacterium]
MIHITDSALAHFRKLIEQESIPGLGVLLSAVDPATPRADARLEFVEPVDLAGDEWATEYDGFTLYVAADSMMWLDGAEIDYVYQGAGTRLTIRAPKIKGEVPDDSASLAERVRWIVDHEINPQLAQHRGRVDVEDVSADGNVILRFGGGCQGCGMADVTLKQGIEKTLMARIPEITSVRDITDHERGDAPYMPRRGGSR